MNESFFKQLVAELVTAQGQAMGILASALCQQVDAKKLKTDLRQQIAAAAQVQSLSPTALRMANDALAAVTAEAALQANDQRG